MLSQEALVKHTLTDLLLQHPSNSTLAISEQNRELACQIGSIHPDTRAVVCIAAAAFRNQETDSLPLTLEKLVKVDFPYDEWEVVIFCNWPTGEQLDKCAALARDFRSLIPVRVLEAQLSPGSSIGYIRSLLHGAVSLRARQLSRDLVFVTMDADTTDVSPQLLSGFLAKLEEASADACVGQLDWDNPHLRTATVPELFVGQEMMRLLPKHGNKHIITQAAKGQGSQDLVIEAVFSPRSFGRGVQSNLAFRNSAYQAVGGFLEAQCDEYDSLLQRIWWNRVKKRKCHGALCFGWREDGVWVNSDSRRALWALKTDGFPPICQWSAHQFKWNDDVRHGLPDMDPHQNGLDGKKLCAQINQTLTFFNLPQSQLSYAVTQSLTEIGLRGGDYTLSFSPYPQDEALSVAQVRLLNEANLLNFVDKQRHALAQ